MVVLDMLKEHFPDVLDLNFTDEMETDLDEIALGDRPWEPVVHDFYEPLEQAVKLAIKSARTQVEETDEICDKCGSTMVIRWGRFGKFVACSSYPDCKNSRPLEAPADAEAAI